MQRRISPGNSCATGKGYPGEGKSQRYAAGNTAIMAVSSNGHLARRSRLAAWKAARLTGKMPLLQHLVPFALVFEHDFAKQANGRHPVIEHLVVEFLQ
jgi:hypothetical protein